MNILAGYEVGTGKPVQIPLRHMAITGLTQISGKTTAMEALVERSGFRAVAFLTKRGEAAFQFGHEVPPYFQERADWKFVKDLFEQITGYSQNDKEAEIIRLCQDARSLEKVWQRVRDRLGIDEENKLLMAKGKRPRLNKRADDMYIRMNAYFEEIMPKLAAIPRSARLQLKRGINVIDLRPYEHGIQELLLTNAFEWVYEKEERVIFVVPEAWDFLSEEHGSITRTAGREFIRRSAALQNFLWADCQDIRGLDKTILGQMGVWLVGNQRELNEVARTIKSFVSNPEPPTVNDIMTLGIGEFYVLHDAESHRTYVQPVWADAHACALYAKLRDEKGRPRAPLPKMPPAPPRPKRDSLPGSTPSQSVGDAQPSGHASPAVAGEQSTGPENPERYSPKSLPKPEEGAVTLPPSSVLDDRRSRPRPQSTIRAIEDIAHETARQHGIGDSVAQLRADIEVVVTTHANELHQLRAEFERLRGDLRELAETIRNQAIGESMPKKASKSNGASPAVQLNGAGPRIHLTDEGQREELYQWFRDRVRRDPEMLAVLASKPEIRVSFQRPVIEANANTLRGRLAMMIRNGFFKEPTNASRAFDELQRTWRNVGKPNVYKECDSLTEMGFLTKEENGYQAVAGMKISTVEA